MDNKVFMDILNYYLQNSMSRKTLREIAKSLDIPRGKNKRDTIINLLNNWSKVEKIYQLVLVKKDIAKIYS